ncbi:hypothetical protein evm_009136 [Chilo suppressalis]|nr:hypothetical protein evm_009136 [Chilo suppressalis]
MVGGIWWNSKGEQAMNIHKLYDQPRVDWYISEKHGGVRDDDEFTNTLQLLSLLRDITYLCAGQLAFCVSAVIKFSSLKIRSVSSQFLLVHHVISSYG